jgi:uncharacterized RDD family membrane protein YckC
MIGAIRERAGDRNTQVSAPGYQVSRDPTAVIGTRTAAYIVDVLLFFVIFLALGPTPLSPLAEYSKVPDGMDMEDACKRVGDVEDVSGCLLIGDKVYFTDGTDTAVYSLAALAYFILVYVLWQGASGLTPGKLLFGLRTVGEDGRSPGPLKALIRSILWIVDGLPCIPLVGFVTGLTSTGHRRVGDMAAKTFVVGKGDAGQPIVVPGMATSATAYGTPTVYGGGPGYASQVPSSAPWGAQPPGPPGAGAPGASPWGTPTPSGPQPPYGAAPMPGANPAPPAPSYGAPAPSDAPSPSGGYPAPAAPPPPGATPGAPFAPPTSPTAPAGPVDAPPTTPMPEAAPDASAFGESSDPSDADLPSGENEPATSSSTPSGEAPAVDSSGSTPAGGTTSGGDAAVGDVEATDAEGASGEPASAQAEVGGETGTTPSGGAITEPGGSSPSANAPAGAAASGSDQTYNPQWDAARGAYIQWDPNRSRWLQWDDAAKEWKPI